MDPEVQYLLSLIAVRERAKVVGNAAQRGELNHFVVNESGLDDAADYVISIIKRDFGPDRYDQIPPHGRWQHFEVGGIPRVTKLLQDWETAGLLLDAGAGDLWHYVEPSTGHKYERSEGIAIASLYMFQDLAFTTLTSAKTPLVDGKGLELLTNSDLELGFQHSDSNPIVGIESRAELLRNLGESLLAHPDVFGPEGRPGNLLDHLVKTAGSDSSLDVHVLWDTLQNLLIPVWPKDRTTVNGKPIGDAWPLEILKTESKSTNFADSVQPFHKLTQWLTYSLMVPFQRVLGSKWINTKSLTALAEYRNGGLFVDFGALSLKEKALKQGLKNSNGALPQFDANDDVIVEWRAMTIVLLDKIYEKISVRMKDDVHLSMAQVIEGGTWKAGRQIAAERRPTTKSSPILIRSDGTVF